MKGDGSWHSLSLWGLGQPLPPQGLRKSYDSQGETNSIVKVTEKNRAAFLPTD